MNGYNVFHNLPDGFGMAIPGFGTPSIFYLGHGIDWWRPHVEWYNRMHCDDPAFMPVSEQLLEVFMSSYGMHMEGFATELNKVHDYWAKRPGLDDFLCG